ncbi:MAG: hypothetical protein VW949_05050, partial [Paracoccaceae bacterium]
NPKIRILSALFYYVNRHSTIGEQKPMRKRKSLFLTLPEMDPNPLHAIVHSQFTDELWHAPPVTK